MAHYNDMTFLGADAPNINHETGIRVGFISVHSVSSDSLDDVTQGDDLTFDAAVSEAKDRIVEALRPILDDLGVLPSSYGADGEKKVTDYLTEVAQGVWDGVEQDFNDRYESDNASYRYEKDGYVVEYSNGSALCTVDVIRSPFFTYVAFGSPCIPNGGDLDTPRTEDEGGVKTYALGHDWFEGGTAPYPVFDVATGGEVTPE